MLFFLKNVFVFLLFVIFVDVDGLYEDQIGKIDWRKQLFGHVKKTIIDDTIGSKKVFLYSDNNVLASVGLNSGQLQWRQVLEANNSVVDIALCGQHLFSLSPKHLRAWNARVGNLENEIALLSSDNELKNFDGYLSCFEGSISQKLLLAVTSHQIILLNAQYATPLVTYTNNLGFPVLSSFSVEKQLVVFFGEHENVIKFHTLSKLGDVKKDVGKLAGISLTKCAISKTRFVCIKSEQSLQIFDLSGKLLATISSKGLSSVQSTASDSHFLLTDTEGSMVYFDVSLEKSSEPGSLFVSTMLKGKFHMLNIKQLENNVEVAVYDSSDISNVGRVVNFSMENHHGLIVNADALLFTKRDGSIGLRLLVSTEDDALHIFAELGERLWVREESLADIVSVETVDLPAADQDELITTDTGSVVTNFVNRVTAQVQHLIKGSTVASSMSGLIRDEFNLHKLILVATKCGKLFALDSISGEPVWSLFVPQAELLSEGQLPLYMQRTSAHYPRPARATVIYRNKKTKLPMLYSFNPINGVLLQFEQLSTSLLQAFQLPLPSPGPGDLEFTRPLLLLDKSLKVSVFPSNIHLPMELHNLYLYTADRSTSLIQGYRVSLKPAFHGDHLKAIPTWSVALGETVLAIASKRATEHVHSPGRVLGDRHVLYKYMNPNLVAVITEGADTVTSAPRTGAPFTQLTVTLLDTVSGRIVASGNHWHSSGPLEVVHSEHWLVYSYWNQRYRRHQLSVWELYAPSLKDCLNASHPTVSKQSYILPSPVRRMTVTNTEKGITSKAILLALNNGGVLELAKVLADPRRPFDMTPEHQEENLVPYHPEIPINPLSILNYNQTLYRVSGMYTAPAGLESTSLLFVYGSDLYFTRVQPSKMFDVLKEDFDYFFIATITIGMVVGSFITQKLAARKALYRQWQ